MNASDEPATHPSNVADLRAAFDQGFAAPQAVRVAELEDFLAVRLSGTPFALRVAELGRIEVGGKVVALPGSDPWLLGLRNSQGKLVPIYSLELALGFERAAGEKNWVAICGREEPIGLEFGTLEGYLRIPRTDVLNMSGERSAGTHEQEGVRTDEDFRPIIQLNRVAAMIASRILSLAIGHDK